MPCNPTLIWITLLFKAADLQQPHQVSLAQQAGPEHSKETKALTQKVAVTNIRPQLKGQGEHCVT